jgi:predicted nucleic acid-binding protein
MLRVFLDANILFMAAYRPAGPVGHLVELQDAGMCTLASSAYALEEARRNIALKAPASVTMFEHWLTHVEAVRSADAAHTRAAAEFNIPDPTDVPILAAAMQTRADILVTADRRAFGHLFRSRCGTTEVLRLDDALKRIIGQPLDILPSSVR